jgi:asparagine synthase (glutamine-hydrolysing)
LNGDESKVKRYWHPAEQPEYCAAKNDESYICSFRQLLRDSINDRLPANLPIGTLLSGGLDSTYIAFIVNDLIDSAPPSQVKTPKLQELFSAVYKEHTEQGDEILFIKQVENALKNKVNYVFPSVIGRWDDIKRFVFYIEQPVAVFNYFVFWCLFQAASKKVKVVFSGQGCDALFGGQTDHYFTYFVELWRKRKIGALLNELIRSSDWIFPNMVYRILFERNARFRAKTLLRKEFVKKYDQNSKEKNAESLHEALMRDIMYHAPEYLRVDDRASSAFSIECRHPFLDNKIVEFAFSLPSDQKIRKGVTKYVIRNAVKGIVPETIRKKRKKSGTPIPQQRWMKDLYENIMETFHASKFQSKEYFNQPAVLNLFSRYCLGKLNRIERECYANLLWRIINLELWFEIFFDSESKIYNEGMKGYLR